MRIESRGGVLVVSVDTEINIDQQTIQDRRQLDTTCARLADVFSRYQIPATWGIADPANSHMTEVLAAADGQHEIAILGDETWVGPSAGRRQFARELIRRVHGARTIGLGATTLLLQNTQLTEHQDLLFKHGVSMVRPCVRQQTSSGRVGSAQTLRFGVWQLPATVIYPNQNRWLPVGGTVAIRHALRRTLAGGYTAHLTIDLPQLARLGQRGIQSFERLLRDVRSGRRGTTVETKTLSNVATELSRPRQSIKSQSLLRKAA